MEDIEDLAGRQAPRAAARQSSSHDLRDYVLQLDARLRRRSAAAPNGTLSHDDFHAVTADLNKEKKHAVYGKPQVIHEYRAAVEDGFNHLEKLSYGRVQWTDDDVKELAWCFEEVPCPNVIELDLSWNDMKDGSGLEQIGHSIGLGALHGLQRRDTPEPDRSGSLLSVHPGPCPGVHRCAAVQSL